MHCGITHYSLMGKGRVVDCPAVLRRAGAVRHAIVPDYARDAQSIVREDRGASPALCRAVGGQIAPRPDRRLVAPERQRQQLARLPQALEPFHRDEAVDRLELRAQGGGDVQVLLPALRLGPDLEDHGYHGLLPFSCGMDDARDGVLMPGVQISNLCPLIGRPSLRAQPTRQARAIPIPKVRTSQDRRQSPRQTPMSRALWIQVWSSGTVLRLSTTASSGIASVPSPRVATITPKMSSLISAAHAVPNRVASRRS